MSNRRTSVWDTPVSLETTEHLNRLARVVRGIPAGVLAEALRRGQETESEQVKMFQVEPNPWFWFQEID